MHLQQLGILQKVNHSEWAALVVVVPKGDGCLKVCRDYKVTVKPVYKYPLQKPDDGTAGRVFKARLKPSLPADLVR